MTIQEDMEESMEAASNGSLAYSNTGKTSELRTEITSANGEKMGWVRTNKVLLTD